MRAFVLLAAVICAARSATVPLHHLAAAGLIPPSSAGYFLGDAPVPAAIASLHQAAQGASFGSSASFAPARLTAPSIPGAIAPANHASHLVAKCWPFPCPPSPAAIFANHAAPPSFFADSPIPAANMIDAPSAPAASPIVFSSVPAGVASPVPYSRAAFPEGAQSVTLFAPGSAITIVPASASDAAAKIVDLASLECVGYAPAVAAAASTRLAGPVIAGATPVGFAAPGSYFVVRSPGAAVFGPASATSVSASPASRFFVPALASAGFGATPMGFAAVPSEFAPSKAYYAPGTPVSAVPVGTAAFAPAPSPDKADSSTAHLTSASPSSPDAASAPPAAL